MARVRRVCIHCGKLTDQASVCKRCSRERNRVRNRERPWYRTPGYRDAQVRARRMAGQPCPRCHKPMTGRHRPSVDHISPIARGGSWSGPYAIICLSCNIRKHNRV